MEKFALSVNEVVAELGLGRTTVAKLLASGQLKSIRVGSRRLIPRQALVEFLEHGTDRVA